MSPCNGASPILHHLANTAASIVLCSLLTACGGGGGGDGGSADTSNRSTQSARLTSSNMASSSTTTLSTTPVITSLSDGAPLPMRLDPAIVMTMQCVDGSAYQCSGNEAIRIDNGVTLTRSGVQVYGKSTSDLESIITDVTTASGLALATGGLAEVRVSKQNPGAGFALLLNRLDLSWDGITERPAIIETFNTSAGRASLDANGAFLFGSLPDSTNLAFYDYAVMGRNGTQANYANNRYFPRVAAPRCPPQYTGTCPAVETSGFQTQGGDWHANGTVPDSVQAGRLHEDGDIHAGNGQPDQHGNATVLPDGTGFGVPFPGSKGFRSYDGWNYAYVNLSAWTTLDTVQIVEWGGALEHNKSRRGMVAFGEVSDPWSVPSTGTATYKGMTSGWTAQSADDEPQFFAGTVTVTVNFDSRQVTVTVSAPFALTITAGMGASGNSVANYFNGAVHSGSVNGGLGGRFFGPVIVGQNGQAPAEIGGTFSWSDANGGTVSLGGFIARRQ